jgi:predicted nucleic acid-binding Zn ribbon protein
MTAYHGRMSDVRHCEQCGREFIPRREHSRFCSAECRLAWNKANARHVGVSVAALDWSLTAMSEATGRLARARILDPRHAAGAVSDATWWVTIVDATLVRYLPASYDATMDAQPPRQRTEIELTLAGLRYVRNQIGIHLDPVEFISQQRSSLTWSPLPPPHAQELTPRGQDWERGRYLAYQERLAGHSVIRTFALAARFLRLAAATLPTPDEEHELGEPAKRDEPA